MVRSIGQESASSHRCADLVNRGERVRDRKLDDVTGVPGLECDDGINTAFGVAWNACS